MASGRLPSLTAVKHGLAEFVTSEVTSRLVDGDARFPPVWSQTASIPGSFGEGSAAFFFALIRALEPANIVEIGSYLGRSTAFLLLASRAVGTKAHVTSIDPHTGDRQQMEKLGLSVLPSKALFDVHIDSLRPEGAVSSLVSTSHEAAQDWNSPVDLLYVDGWHSYDAVLQDGMDWLPSLTQDGVVIFDDYARYDEVFTAVHELVRGGHLHLWGNVFGQAVGGRATAAPAALAPVIASSETWLSHRLWRPRAAG